MLSPLPLKENEIKFEAIAKGGYNVCPTLMPHRSSSSPTPRASKYGLGSYNNSDINKYLQGKQVGVSVQLSDDSRDVEGSSTIQDLPP